MLTAEQIAAREGKLTASMVAPLMTGDEAKVMQLYYELTDDPRYEPVDLSGVWPVQLGSVTEQLQLDWFQRKHGPVTRRGEVVVGDPDWMACTLDGWSTKHGHAIETKHCGGRESLAVLIQRYQPQCHWQMLVTGTRQCAFSVIMGADEPVVEFLPLDEAYAKELMIRATAFMLCVESLTPPFVPAPVAPPVKAVIEYEMTSNAWTAYAHDWLANLAAKKIAEKAEKELKILVPSDAIRCFGSGIEIRRDRAGRLGLRSAGQ